jgi:16S rRNA (cytosine967-C5)-methyltransferase
MAAVTNPRLVAVRVLLAVLQQGHSLTRSLEQHLIGVDTEAALVRAMCYGCCRWYFRLRAVADSMLDKPLKSRDRDVDCLILLGLFQLIYLRVPDHAVVQETVAVTRALKKHWASGLVNALLRRFQRQADNILAAADQDPVALSSHPRWLLESLQQAWPDDWSRLVAANNEQAPMTLRVNLAALDREQYLAQLQAAGIQAQPALVGEAALVLQQALDVERLPGFTRGQVSVQDAAAQLAAPLLCPEPGARVLDACAAPGGKTAHLLEYLRRAGDTSPALTAVDIDAQRSERTAGTLQRLGLSADMITADVADSQHWWGGIPFDHILLDAPCSATGVIRRHPDIKLLRRASDVPMLAHTQAALLRALWPLLRPGGMLLYVTCSVLPQENAQLVAAFLQDTADAREVALDTSWGHAQEVGRQILPGEQGMDGFYYAKLNKQE